MSRRKFKAKGLAIWFAISWFPLVCFASVDASFDQQITRVEQYFVSQPELAFELAQQLNSTHPNRVEPKIWLARLYSQFSDFDKSFSLAKQAMEQEVTAKQAAYLEMSIGYFYTYKQNQEQALKHFELAVKAAAQSEDNEVYVEVLSIRADILIIFNQVEQALRDMELAFTMVDQVQKPSVLASLHNTMSAVYSESGDTVKAIDSMLEAIVYIEQNQNVQQLSVVYFNLGNLFTELGQYQESLDAFQRSKNYSVEAKDNIGLGFAEMGLGHSLLYAGKPAEAVPALQRAEAILVVQQHTRNLIRIYGDLAEAYLQLQQYDQVRASLNKLEQYSQFDNDNNRAFFLRAKQTLAKLYFALEDFENAFLQQQMYLEALQTQHSKELQQVDEQAFEHLNDTIMARENEVLKLENQLGSVQLEEQKKQSMFLLLVAVISIFVSIFVTLLLRKNSKLRAQLDVLASTDELTQVYNRRKIMSVLSEAFVQAQASSGRIYVALFDLDHFKNINDSQGHVMGDTVLKAVTECAKQVIGPDSLLGRYGGEEFLVLVRASSYQAAYDKLEQLRESVAQLQIADSDVRATISIGLSESRDQDEYQTDVIHRADKALYQAKKEGRNRLVGG